MVVVDSSALIPLARVGRLALISAVFDEARTTDNMRDEVLLANDKGLIQVARTHGGDCWWVTTLLLKYAKDEVLTATEATNFLYNLVDAGMNPSPKVYSQVQQKLQDLGE